MIKCLFPAFFTGSRLCRLWFIDSKYLDL